MHQRTPPRSPNGQINTNITAWSADYEAGYLPMEFQFSSVNQCDSRRVCELSPLFIYKYTFM
jgi:hypothetical protein